MPPVNRITVLRKRVVANIPMFDDEDTGNPQNEWIKLYDFDCVDICPGMTAKVYNLEHDPNYDNQDTTYYTEFHFSGPFQTIEPPYDILEGDYVGCRQNGQVFFYRIVKTITTQVFVGCCDYQLICNTTTPREQERLMGCGVLSVLEKEDYENEQNSFTYTKVGDSSSNQGSALGGGEDESGTGPDGGTEGGSDGDEKGLL